MSEINTGVWGASATWSKATPYFSGSNTPDDDAFYYGEFPKLVDMVDAGRLSFDTPIDNSICYAGQAQGMPLASLHIDSYDVSGNQAQTGGQDAPTGWFFTYAEQSGVIGLTVNAFHTLYTGGNYEPFGCFSWKPNGAEEVSGYKNRNNKVRPIVKFNPHAVYLAIRCQMLNMQTGAVTARWLYDLDNGNAHTDEVIIHAEGLIYVKLNNSDNYSVVSSRVCGVAINQPFKVGSSDLYDYMYLSDAIYGSYGAVPLYGYQSTGQVVRDSNDNLYYNEVTDYNRADTPSPNWGYSMANVFVDTLQSNSNDRLTYISNPDNPRLIHRRYAPNTAANCELLRKCAAAYGLFFTDKRGGLLADNANRWTSEDMYMGLLRGGVGYGDYTRGEGNRDNPGFGWTSSTQSGYVPSQPVDPNVYDSVTGWNTVTARASFTRRYELSLSSVQQLAYELWQANATKPVDVDMKNFALDEYLTNNPIDAIVSLKFFPFGISSAAAPAAVFLGKYQTAIAGNATGDVIKIINFPSIPVVRHYNDFRDFEPYTKLSLYIPFCGTINIPTSEIMGHSLNVKLAVDLQTGACTGFVMADSICIATASGTMSIDIPVSGLQSADLSNAVYNAVASWTQTQISNGKISSGLLSHGNTGILGSIARGFDKVGVGGLAGLANIGQNGDYSGVGSIISVAAGLDPIKAMGAGIVSDVNSAKADYELTHIDTPMRLIGNASPLLGCVIESNIRLIITRPITDDSATATYAETVGYATLDSGTVSQFSGLTVGTIDVSGISATASEKQAIADAFASGVYL